MVRPTRHATEPPKSTRQLVSMLVAGQQFGVPIEAVRDILGFQRLARVPLAPPEIAGVLNLRGRIVTAIDLRCRLGIKALAPGKSAFGSTAASASMMNVVVDQEGELYSLLVDRVGDVLTLDRGCFESDARTLPAHWRTVANGIFRMDEALLVELDVARVLALQDAL